MNVAEIKPVTVLICAMGGEGGGLLMRWIVEAAMTLDLPVQSTSVPGVAQRTGATTYYLEIYPKSRAALAKREVVLSLYPSLGDLDLVVASELVEVGRALQRGYVHPQRSTLIGSTHRVYSIAEKSVGDDGRFDGDLVLDAAPDLAAKCILFDIDAAARDSGCILNAVMLGAIAGSAVLPIPVEALRRSISAGSKAVAANLRGFDRGLAQARGEIQTSSDSGEHQSRESSMPKAFAARTRSYPAVAQSIIAAALSRLVNYQDDRYAALYLDRMDAIRNVDADFEGASELTCEVARLLALWMSYEDAIRVAQHKISRARLEDLRSRGDGAENSIVTVTEYLKPGIDEICSVLPPVLARTLLRANKKWGRGREVGTGMRVRTSTISGFLSLWVIARLRPLRRIGYRYQQEQGLIDAWLSLVQRAAVLDRDLALEVARCARLVKGYGATHDQGLDHYQSIVRDLIEPALSGEDGGYEARIAIASARETALRGPEQIPYLERVST